MGSGMGMGMGPGLGSHSALDVGRGVGCCMPRASGQVWVEAGFGARFGVGFRRRPGSALWEMRVLPVVGSTLVERSPELDGQRSRFGCRHLLSLALTCTPLIAQVGCNSIAPAAAPLAIDGTLDLTNWSPELQGIVPLRGEWQLYWHRLLTSSDFHSAGPIAAAVLHSPNLEFDKSVSGQDVGDRDREGFATYRLRVRMPQRSPAEEAADPWMIAIDTQGRPYELELVGADGRPLASMMRAGRVGKSAEAWVPSERDQHRELLPAANGLIEIILRTGYFATGNRIKKTEISLGRSSDLGHSIERSRQNRLILIGICLVMGFYHLGLYLLRRGERAPLYFSLLSILFSVRHFFRYDLFEDRFPGLDAYPLHASIEYSTFFFSVALFIAFLRSLFPLDLPRFASRGVAAVAITCSLLVALPLRIGAAVLSFFELFTIIAIILASVLMVRAIVFRRDPPVTTILGIGIAVLLAVTLNDILLNLALISSTPLEHFGVFAFIFAQAMVLALLNMRSRKQAEDLARSLRRFVPGEFSQILGKQDITNVELGDSVLSEMTVLFCDIRGFTGLSERNDVGEVFSLLNAIYARLVPLIREHGGFIDKYIGDAIMAIFPASPVDSVRASVAIAEAARSIELPTELAQTTLLARHLAVGIGIHRGSVMLGMIGEQQRMEATVIADVVNVASRLEGLSKHFGAGILISGELYRSLVSENSGDELIARETRSLGRVRLAGKRQSVEVYEVFVGDGAELRAVKRGGLADFAAALAHFEAGDFAAATAGFSALCAPKNPGSTGQGQPPVDQPAAIYAAASSELLASPPEHEWQGILEILGK